MIITINNGSGLSQSSEAELASLLTLLHHSFIIVIIRLIISSISCINPVILLHTVSWPQVILHENEPNELHTIMHIEHLLSVIVEGFCMWAVIQMGFESIKMKQNNISVLMLQARKQ